MTGSLTTCSSPGRTLSVRAPAALRYPASTNPMQFPTLPTPLPTVPRPKNRAPTGPGQIPLPEGGSKEMIRAVGTGRQGDFRTDIRHTYEVVAARVPYARRQAARSWEA